VLLHVLLRVLGGAFQFWQLPDFGNSGDLFFPRHPPLSQLMLQTKGVVQFDPWEARLGGPCVAQGWPLGGPNPIPNPIPKVSAEGRRLLFFIQLPNYPFTKFHSATVKRGNPHIHLFSKSLGWHIALRRWHILGDSQWRIKCEIGQWSVPEIHIFSATDIPGPGVHVSPRVRVVKLA
jgi:hypothetical protein